MFEFSSVMAILLAVLAGLSTMLGALVVVLMKKRSDSLLSAALGLASGVMVSACFLDLYPEGQEYFELWGGHQPGVLMSLVFLAVGVAAAMLFHKFFPHHCGSCEHEHHHHDDEVVSRAGVVSMTAIALHNIPEGIALFFAASHDLTMGIVLTVAVALHNIPGGISISMPIYYSSGSRKKALLYTLLPSLVQPAGALLAAVLLRNVMNDFMMGIMFCVVAGFLLFIALVELYPMSRDYAKSKANIYAMFVGMLLIPLAHLMHHHHH